ncbi:UNVERIFIED_CONTAM: hypothetical protein GTU68_042929 [Idotea baltica]|nr:hypothetical protein [Idotea baltica]
MDVKWRLSLTICLR